MKLSKEISDLFKGAAEQELGPDLSHPVMQEWYRTYVEPKLAAQQLEEDRLSAEARAALEATVGFVLESAANHKIAEEIHGPDIELQAEMESALKTVEMLASVASAANNQKAAYMIELAAAQIREIMEE